MPTLPGGATSILAVLGRFAPPRQRASAQFDWPALVANARPGSETASQRQQALRLGRVQAGLAPWLGQWGLSPEHLEESALYATVSMPPDTSDVGVLHIARTIAWIYAIDDFIDKPSASGDDDRADMRRDLAAIFAPLAAISPRALRRAPWVAQRRSGRSPAMSSSAQPLHDALAALLARRETTRVRRCAPWGGDARRQIAAEQMIACAAMMCRERRWSDAAHSSGHTLPSASAYLEVGTVSIGMAAVAAAVAGCETHARRRWRTARRAVDAAGSIVRLTNDLNTYEADVDEGKVSAVTIRLRDLGFAPFGHDPDASREVRRAQAWVASDLARAVEAFSRLQVALPIGPLSYYLRHSVAFALAVYGDGARHEISVAP